jgi:hypothetical protein
MRISRFGGNKDGLGIIELIRLAQVDEESFELVYNFIIYTNYHNHRDIERLQRVLRDKLDVEMVIKTEEGR